MVSLLPSAKAGLFLHPNLPVKGCSTLPGLVTRTDRLTKRSGPYQGHHTSSVIAKKDVHMFVETLHESIGGIG